jgi:predicted membrane protein
MVSVAVYFLLTLLGIAVGLEVSARNDVDLGTWAALWSILTLLLAMFLGGWATSRLAVGETKLEAILYGVILWGVLFIGMFWLFGVGVRIGFGAMMGMASGATSMAAENGSSGAASNNAGVIDQLAQRYNRNFSDPKFVEDLKKLGVEEGVAKKVQSKVNEQVETLRNDPAALPGELKNDPDVQQAGEQIRRGTKAAVWYSLLGIIVSMATVILGSLIGSGDIPVPITFLGVRRVPPQRP